MYAKHHQELFRYCLSILRNREDAEDALQATMAAALRSLPAERREIALRPWLFRVAHNESISLLRTRRPTAELDDHDGHAGPTAEAALEERDRLRQLVADLRSLPERQSAAIVMRELSGLSYAEIAAAVSSSEGAVRQAVYEGRVALRANEEGREMECENVRQVISNRDGRRLRGRALRAHLEECDGCTAFAASIERRRSDLAALCPPIPALAAAGVFSGVLGGGGHGGAAAAAGGASAASATGIAGVGGGVAGSLAIKGAALVAAAGIAAGAADIGGAIDIAHPFGKDDASVESAVAPPAPAELPVGRAGAVGAAAPVGAPPAAGRGDRRSGRAGSRPGAPAKAPGHGGSNPGKSDAAPGHAGTTAPGKSESAPGRTGTPGKSESAPGQAGGSPGQSASAPGQSGNSPGKSESAPGQAADAATPEIPASGSSNGNGTPPAAAGGSKGNSPK